jgi:HPt (histidine-containing phosphotransfer) domain-containing protein
VKEIIRLFLRDAPARIEALRQALEAGDADAAMHAAHALKGTSANIGAHRLADLCEEMEERTRSGSVSGTKPIFASLESEFEGLKLELKAAA